MTLKKILGIGSEHDLDSFDNVFSLLCTEKPDIITIEAYVNAERALDILSKYADELRKGKADESLLEKVDNDFELFAGINYALANGKPLYFVDAAVTRDDEQGEIKTATELDDVVALNMTEVKNFDFCSATHYRYDDKTVESADVVLSANAAMYDINQTKLDAQAVPLRNRFSAEAINRIGNGFYIAHIGGKAHFDEKDFLDMMSDAGITCIGDYKSIIELVDAEQKEYVDVSKAVSR